MESTVNHLLKAMLQHVEKVSACKSQPCGWTPKSREKCWNLFFSNAFVMTSPRLSSVLVFLMLLPGSRLTSCSHDNLPQCELLNRS